MVSLHAAAAPSGPAVVAAAGPAESPRGRALDWETAFPLGKPTASVHFVARFSGRDEKAHRLEVWRYGRAFLHRRTDDALDLYVAARREQPGEYDYRFIDHRRHVSTDVQRSNLYRIGVFSDWFGLAHVLDRPKTSFEVTALPASAGAETLPFGRHLVTACAWRLLRVAATEGVPGAEARICWSRAWGLPVAIYRRTAQGLWTEQLGLASVTEAPPAAGAVQLPAPPPSYGVVEANEEIAPKAAADD